MNKILSNHSSTDMLFPRLSNTLRQTNSSDKDICLHEIDQSEVDENIKKIKDLEREEKMASF